MVSLSSGDYCVEKKLACKQTKFVIVLNHSESLRIKINLFNLYIDSNAIKLRKINREFRMEICDVGNELLLVLFSLSSVDDKHNVRNSHASLSNISGQDNLKEMQFFIRFFSIHFIVFLNGLVNFFII